MSPFATIAISVLSSGAFAALITFLTNRRLKLIDYKFDYRKYILQKRQNAYNDIEQFLIRLGKKTININSNKPLHFFFIDRSTATNPVNDFLGSLTATLNRNTFWITSDLHDKIIDLYNYLESYHMARNEQGVITLSQFEDMATASFDKIEDYRIKIYSQFFDDIKELDDIETFKLLKFQF